MIAVITGAAVAFFQSTRVERFVARNYADLARAQLAAEGGAAFGQALITTLFTNYPDSAVGWARMADTELATFYFRTTDTNGFLTNGVNAALPASQPVFLFAYPLVSGANPVQQGLFSGSAAVFTNTNGLDGLSGLTASNSVDLNADNWIGTPPGRTRPVLRARWVELLRDPTQGKNTNLSGGVPINPAIARYAFWAEDESFRVNLNWCGATQRGDNTPGTNPVEIPILSLFSGSPATQIALAQGITNLANVLRSNIPTPGSMTLATNIPYTTFTNTKFVFSTHSSALNFSRGGVRRVNLNQVMTNIPFTATNVVGTNTNIGPNSQYSGLVRTQLNRVISTVTNRYAMPDFGQRFYRVGAARVGGGDPGNDLNAATGANAVTPDDALIYLNKLAANIRDYIDTDSQPTILTNDLAKTYAVVPLPPGNATLRAFDFDNVSTGPHANRIIAAGQEAVPLLTEYALRVALLSGLDTTNPIFQIRVSHYFEFWNPYNKPVAWSNLGGNPYLHVYNQIGWQTASGVIRPPDLKIPLNSFAGPAEIPAGSFAVLTTDPQFTEAVGLLGILGNVRSSASAPVLSGTAREEEDQKSGSFYQIKDMMGGPDGRAGGHMGGSDYETQMVVASDTGQLSSFSSLPVPTSINITADPDAANGSQSNSVGFFRGGSLRGNGGGDYGSGSQSGDPRSLNEQLRYTRYTGPATIVDRLTAGGGEDQGRFYSTGMINGTNPRGSSSMGSLGTGASAYVDTSGGNPASWADWSGTGLGDGSQPFAVIRDGPMQTIGELGHIYDPVRFPGSDVQTARGGGSTLKIGQRENYNQAQNFRGLWGAGGGTGTNTAEGNQTNASRNWTAWRLTDVFCVNPPDRNGNGQVDTAELTRIDGLININNVARDNGRVLRAMVQGLQMQAATSGGAPTTGGFSLNINNLTNGFVGRVLGTSTNSINNPADDNIFWERGEISEIPIFSSGTGLLTNNVNLELTLDRGREEVVRRLMDLICTKGNTYSVYAIGQALHPVTGRVVATQRIKMTFRIDPFFATALPTDTDFVPSADVGTPSDRFRRPDRFSNSVLYYSFQ